MLESIQSLRRHYPDQVIGYVLSLFTLPIIPQRRMAGKAPLCNSTAKIQLFSVMQEKTIKTVPNLAGHVIPTWTRGEAGIYVQQSIKTVPNSAGHVIPARACGKAGIYV